MTTPPPPPAVRWRHVLAAACAVSALAAYAGGERATPPQRATSSDFAGTWEIVRVLTRNDEWTPWAPRPDDPREIGQRLEVAQDRLSFSHISAQCKLVPAKSALDHVPVARLFSGRDEPAKRDSVVGDIRGRLNGQAKDYGADIARERTVTLTRIQCGRAGSTQPMPWPDPQNWIAKPATRSDTLWWSREPNSLFMLRRMPAPRPTAASAVAACQPMDTPTDRAICRSRDLQSLRDYVDSPERFVRQIEVRLTPEEKQAFAAMPGARVACGEDEACLRKRLTEQVHYLIFVEDRYAALPR